MIKILYIQIHEGSYYKKLAKERTLKNFEIQASRGNIYSDDNSLLATSVTKYEIRWDSKVPSQKLINNSTNFILLYHFLNEDNEYDLSNIPLFKLFINSFKALIVYKVLVCFFL